MLENNFGSHWYSYHTMELQSYDSIAVLYNIAAQQQYIQSVLTDTVNKFVGLYIAANHCNSLVDCCLAID